MTLELISNMLGVHREGVTEAAAKLQKAGIISYSRGRIVVLDRSGLEKLTAQLPIEHWHGWIGEPP